MALQDLSPARPAGHALDALFDRAYDPTDAGAPVSISSADATDELLMTRVQSGDAAAFAILVRRHQLALYNYALRRLRSTASAEEIVQETFARVAQSSARFTRTSRFSPWVYTIARNLCVDALRRGAHRRHASLDEPLGAGEQGPTLGEETADPKANTERAVGSLEIRERVVAAIDALPEDQRDVFLLREVANLPFREIAQVVNAPENTVKSRMRYALERLQAALVELEEYARALR